jgi:hypothetical protein
MEELEHPQSKLLYAVWELETLGRITKGEKHKLKEMILTEQQAVMDLFDTYTHTRDPAQLYNGIVALVKPHRSKPAKVVIPTNSSLNEESSSPLGTFLHEKKKRQRGEGELKLSLLDPQNQTEEDEIPL